MIKTLTIAAMAAAIAMPVLADEGVMPQQSKIIMDKHEVQQGVAKGHEAKSGKRHATHQMSHKAAPKKAAHKKHMTKKPLADKAAM